MKKALSIFALLPLLMLTGCVSSNEPSLAENLFGAAPTRTPEPQSYTLDAIQNQVIPLDVDALLYINVGDASKWDVQLTDMSKLIVVNKSGSSIVFRAMAEGRVDVVLFSDIDSTKYSFHVNITKIPTE